MTQMSTQARELAIAAYRAGEMDFPIGVAAADEDVHDEELIDEWEELVSYYAEFVGDDGTPDPDLDRQPWASYTREQILTAVYLLVTQRAEAEPAPYVGSEATRLLGALAEHLKRELGSLGNVDPLDRADDLAGASA